MPLVIADVDALITSSQGKEPAADALVMSTSTDWSTKQSAANDAQAAADKAVSDAKAAADARDAARKVFDDAQQARNNLTTGELKFHRAEKLLRARDAYAEPPVSTEDQAQIDLLNPAAETLVADGKVLAGL